MNTDIKLKLSERAAAPFERPVDIKAFPDYLQFVENPMELQTVQRRIEHDDYTTSEDFEVCRCFIQSLLLFILLVIFFRFLRLMCF